MRIAVTQIPTVWSYGDDNAFWCEHVSYELESVEKPLHTDPRSGELVSTEVTVAICSDCGEDVSEEVL